jgi:hypothetical protein
MTRDQNGFEKLEKGGYRPLNGGYSAMDQPGPVPTTARGTRLPKAPRGGTGESPAPPTPAAASQPGTTDE